MNKERSWARFLNENFCQADDYTGNRPCDNGMICDHCETDWVEEEFKKWKQEED